MSQVLERRTFSTSRAADFLEQRALVSQTGQPADRFGDVVLKELLDNALDACETAGAQPELEVSVSIDGDLQRVTVADNGAGIPPGVVGRILDFGTLTSDKALYRSPSRGAQGNALKTIIGIPAALKVAEPVIIEAHGVRHTVSAGLDIAGGVTVRHDTADSPRRAGTAITVPLPIALRLDAGRWARRYALVNPHATIALIQHGDDGEPPEPRIYKATADDEWRKPVPGDPTSPWWYDETTLAKLALSLAAAGDDRPAGMFAAEFRGLSSSGKRKQVAAAVPAVRRLSDLAEPGAAAALLAAMREASSPPNFTILGQVPAEHYREILDGLYGVERFWYKHGGVVAGGVPWHIEVAVAETARQGAASWACNYSASFGDPLGGTFLRTAEVSATGAASFLGRCDATPDYANDGRRAAVVHVTCAAPVFTDKGKVQLAIPDEVAEAFARVLWLASKELHSDAKRAERDGRAIRRDYERALKAAQRPQITLRDAVFAVIPEAVAAQQGGTTLPFSARSLYYKTRPLIQALTDKPLADSYFTQVLLPDYQREHGTIPGLYYEPRGELHHPHDPAGKETVPLGTREVSAYTPPDWTYDKILVVEKAGLWPLLSAARIADRYDMAVITSEGFAVEACRVLLAGMASRDVTIFALHDADPSGYNIALTLGEETRRMPGHRAEVIDLGLTVDDAIRLGMEPEEFSRSAALPARITPHLTEAARQWFTGTVSGWDNLGSPKQWKCRRVELNAFSSPGLIAYIEEGLRAHAAAGKVIPPADVIETQARDTHRELLAELVERVTAELLDLDEITLTLTAETSTHAEIEPGDIGDALGEDPHQSWRAAIRDIITVRQRDERDELRTRITELLSQNTRIEDSS